ncbi:MAG: L-seryl-tRNA(Sec) selenium transferase [Desulfobacterales bacterium]|nr:L-seryl-tRNA(Sec) selenium transferase [Desulfobacterales bacterium]
MKDKKTLLRLLPKVDECLLVLASYLEQENVPLRIAKKGVQSVIDTYRQNILNDALERLPENAEEWSLLFRDKICELNDPLFKRVINGTGIVIHTNLGRSILSNEATRQITTAGNYYSNLEFDLKTGKRGSRYSLVEEIICDLTGAEAALVVNNNAAAVLISLETPATGHEVIVSRGQLVEIGGSFRVPDVMEKSGAELVEVGATNRTHLYDFEGAITDRTALLLSVHTSNFRMIGFTSEVSADELVELGNRHDIPVMEDLGSGSLIRLPQFGMSGEPTVPEVVGAGVDIVTFSGDKLLGGPQCGIIVGKRKYIEKIKKNPLNRALRIDKFTVASLESILRCYYDNDSVLQNVPTLRMISQSDDLIKKRARRLIRRLKAKLADYCTLTLVPTVSLVGGGALPEYSMDSWAVSLRPARGSVNNLERDLRALEIPIIGRIEHDCFLLDFRTIQEHEIIELAGELVTYFNY